MLKKIAIYVLLFGLVFPFPSFASEVTFNPNFVISDTDFFNGAALDEAGIQRFLVSKNSYLAQLIDSRTRMSAARIIWYAAQDYNINPKVILATLQKEQSLITSTSRPSDDALDWAMGYAICDSCSKSDPALQDFKGFFNQVKYGTAILDKYKREIESQGKTRSGYAPGIATVIDGQHVIPQNIATASLYTYTPHLHGNKNFYSIWNDWFSFSYPDGTLLQGIGESGVYLIYGNQKRGFESLSALTTRGYKTEKIITVDPEELSKYSTGPQIKYPQYALFEGPDGSRYLFVNETKRKFESDDVFGQLGFNPEEVDELPQEELDLIADGESIGLNDAYPTGALLQNTNTGSVFYVEGGIRHPIIHKVILTARFGDSPSMIPADSDTIKQYVIGKPLALHDGELVTVDDGSDAAVYVISNGYKRPIVSGTTFEQLGYTWDDIVAVPPAVLSLHPTGEVLDLDTDDDVELAAD